MPSKNFAISLAHTQAVAYLLAMMNTQSINQLADQIITRARTLAAGPGRSSDGPESNLTDGRSNYTITRESYISGPVQAALYIEDAAKPIVDALFVNELNDAACAAIDKLEAAAEELGIGELVNL